MAKDQEIKALVGGMDFDSEERYIEDGNYRYAMAIRNGVGYVGERGNVTNSKGNTLVPYTLPAGDNKVIGVKEDKKTRRVVYFIWNSNGDSRIAEYKQDPTGLGHINTIIEYDFRWTPENYITEISIIDGFLLYWSDQNGLHKINMSKAQTYKKKKCWKWIIPYIDNINAFFPTIVVVTLRDENNNLVASDTIDIATPYVQSLGAGTDPRDMSAMLDMLSDAINDGTHTGLTDYVSFDVCEGGYISICEQEFSSEVWNVDIEFLGGAGPANSLAVADNWYGLSLIDRFFELEKWPPMCSPLVDYRQDEEQPFSRVDSTVFQSRLKYAYDDNEESVLGPYSQIPNVDGACFQNEFNHIRIDFNDPRLLQPETLVLLQTVDVVVREGNIRNERNVITLNPWDFLRYDPTGTQVYYDFYNLNFGSGVSVLESSKLTDRVPLSVGGMEVMENRMVVSAPTDGYEPPCNDLKVTPYVGVDPNSETYNVYGYIRIGNWNNQAAGSNVTAEEPFSGAFGTPGTYPDWLNDPATDLVQRNAIYQGNPDDEENGYKWQYPVYGGIAIFGDDTDNNDLVGVNYDQWIPEGGWPVYLAGTDYMAVSKQSIETGYNQDSRGVIDITDEGQSRLQTYFQNNGDIISRFDIKNVPPGVYKVRVASHWCSNGDVLNKGTVYDLSDGSRGYQKTSAHVKAISEVDENTNPWQNWQVWETEIEVTVTNADVFAGHILIEDLTALGTSTAGGGFRDVQSAFSGYLVDADSGSVDAEDALSLPRMERQLLSQLIPAGGGYASRRISSATDHNGHFFFKGNLYSPLVTDNPYVPSGLGYTIQADLDLFDYGRSVTANTQPFRSDDVNNSVFKDELIKQNQMTAGDAYNGHAEFILASEDENWGINNSTYAQGSVEDSSGEALSGVPVVIEDTGREDFTDENGEYSILVYTDHISPGSDWVADTSSPSLVPNSRIGGILFMPIGCHNITSGFVDVLFASVIPTNFDRNNPFDAGVNVCTTQTPPFVNAWKRGGIYDFAYRYQDLQGRFYPLVPAGRVKIPHIDEDLSEYNPIYSPGTFQNGPGFLAWEISGTPPRDAATMQILVTENQNQGSFLQWVANDITYISSYTYGDDTNPDDFSETVYAAGDATHILLDLSNLSEYKNRNQGATVDYSFEVGDRLILLADSDRNFFQQRHEGEVINVRLNNQVLVRIDNGWPEVKAGSLLELHSIANVEQDKVYYEIGSCYPTTAPGSQANAHGTTSAFLDAKDTYWFKRTIRSVDFDDSVYNTYMEFVESNSQSDLYTSNSWDRGRVGIYDPKEGRLTRPATLRVSNPFIPDTLINGVSAFEGVEDKELDRGLGMGVALRRVGDVLSSIHHNGVVSISVQESVLRSAEGGDLALTISDAFLPSENTLLGDYGCFNPESITVEDQRIYGFDAKRGVHWRYGPNGLTPISQKNMRNYFKELADDGVVFAPAGFDAHNYECLLRTIKLGTGYGADFSTDLPNGLSSITALDNEVSTGEVIVLELDGNYIPVYVVSSNATTIVVDYELSNHLDTGDEIVYHKLGQSETIAWDEGAKFYKSFWPYDAECLVGVNQDFLTFKNGNLYLHEEGPYNTWYGVTTNPRLHVVFNANPANVKAWMAMTIDHHQDNGAHDWDVVQISNDRGQVSALPAARFVQREKQWHAAMLRDSNTQGVTAPLFNGERLRSPSITVEMVNTYPGLARLFTVSVNNKIDAR